MGDKVPIGKAARWLKQHPEEVFRVVRNAAGLRFGVPLDALRWAADFAGAKAGKKAPKDVQIEAVPPGLRFGASVDLMGAPVRASAVVFIEKVVMSPVELRFEIRLADVDMKVLDDKAESPVAALLKSGALDLSKPGNLANYMPKRPPMLVEAVDDRVVLDLMKHPKLAANASVRRTLGMVTPVVTVSGIETDWEHLDILLRMFPN